MKQKNAEPDKRQAATIRNNGLNPLLWVVVRDLDYSMIIKHRLCGDFKVITKGG